MDANKNIHYTSHKVEGWIAKESNQKTKNRKDILP